MFMSDGSMFQTENYNKWAPIAEEPWCITRYTDNVGCDMYHYMQTDIDLYVNMGMHAWRNLYTAVVLREPGELDLYVHDRYCDWHQRNGYVASLVGNVFGSVAPILAPRARGLMNHYLDFRSGTKQVRFMGKTYKIPKYLWVTGLVNRFMTFFVSFTSVEDFLRENVAENILIWFRWRLHKAAKFLSVVNVIVHGEAVPMKHAEDYLGKLINALNELGKAFDASVCVVARSYRCVGHRIVYCYFHGRCFYLAENIDSVGHVFKFIVEDVITLVYVQLTVVIFSMFPQFVTDFSFAAITMCQMVKVLALIIESILGTVVLAVVGTVDTLVALVQEILDFVSNLNPFGGLFRRRRLRGFSSGSDYGAGLTYDVYNFIEEIGEATATLKCPDFKPLIFHQRP